MNEQNKQTNQLLQGINLKITLQPDKTNERKKIQKTKKPQQGHKICNQNIKYLDGLDHTERIMYQWSISDWYWYTSYTDCLLVKL